MTFLGHIVTVFLEIAILFSKAAKLLYSSVKFPVFLYLDHKNALMGLFGF